MVKLQNARIRYTKHYINILKALNENYLQGDSISEVINNYILDAPQFNEILRWLQQESSNDPGLHKMLIEFLEYGNPLLTVMVMQEKVTELESRLITVGTDEEKIDILNNLGFRYMRSGDYAKALKVFRQKLQLGQKIGDTFIERNSLNDLALVHLELEDLDRATELLDKVKRFRKNYTKKHIFLSYCREDTSVMQKIQDSLVNAKLRIWVDTLMSSSTNDWRDEVANAIEIAGAIVVLLSPQAKKSDWVKRELAYSLDQQASIFPVIVAGDRKTSVPIQVAHLNWVGDFRDMAEYLPQMRNLIISLRSHLQTL